MNSKIRKNGLLKGLGRNVIVLGFVSFFTDVSSEMLFPIVPLFLKEVLLANMTVIGLIQGIAEGTASLLKVASGWLSDKTARRKPFVIFGYGVSSISKPLLALAALMNSWAIVLASRFLDRFGKGARTAARDALIVSSCKEGYRGKAFGLHRAMDTAGAVVGPLAALLLLWLFAGRSISQKTSYTYIFLISFIPAAVAVFLLIAFAREKKGEKPSERKISLKDTSRISKPFYRFLIIYAIFCIGNSSDYFLLLRARDLGMSAGLVIVAYVYYNIVYAVFSTPAGWLSDRIGRTKMLVAGFAVFSAVYFGLGFIGKEQNFWVWILFAFYGIYAACTEGVSRALVADTCAEQIQGTAMGLLQTVSGVLIFVASLVAGVLWDGIGASAPFYFGGCFAGASAILLVIFRKKLV